MKRILYVLVALVGFTSCEKDNKGLLDPTAKVYINGATAPASVSEVSKAGQTRLTPKEVVERADAFISDEGIMGVADWNRDVANTRIIGAANWVINTDGTLASEFITSRHNILVTLNYDNRPVDTIAYIPNAIMARVEQEVRAAYEQKDYSSCYRLFQEGYQFTSITGAEYKALKEQGKN